MPQNTVKKSVSIDKEVFDLVQLRADLNSSSRSKVINDLLKEQLLIPEAIIENTIKDLSELLIAATNVGTDIDNILSINNPEIITPDLKRELRNFKKKLQDPDYINKLLKILMLINKYQIK